MSKVNIANYIVYNLQNQLNCIENNDMDNEIVGMVAEHWHKKHFVSGPKNIKHNHNDQIRQNFLIQTRQNTAKLYCQYSIIRSF